MSSSSSSSEPTSKKSKAGALKKLIREVLSDSDDNDSSNTAIPSVRDPSRPWRAEFLSYLETIEAVPSAGMSTIQWWGAGPSSLVEELNDSDTEADISEKEGDVADDERGWDTLILDDKNNSDDDISVLSDY
ncbi:hypothetical protein BDR04DRAFT_1120249 [Suillus decipiens]|nr:hypothetical protein BDR04DRAFT_1120249 [Suillus decipiens]